MSTLFAAFEVPTGKVAHTSRQRGIESLDFLNEIVSADLHVGFDNLNTHRPENDGWLVRRYLHFQLTPTRASCVYQIESGSRSSKASRITHFLHLGQVTQGADRCLHTHLSAKAQPLAWTKAKAPPQTPPNLPTVIPRY